MYVVQKVKGAVCCCRQNGTAVIAVCNGLEIAGKTALDICVRNNVDKNTLKTSDIFQKTV